MEHCNDFVLNVIQLCHYAQRVQDVRLSSLVHLTSVGLRGDGQRQVKLFVHPVEHCYASSLVSRSHLAQ